MQVGSVPTMANPQPEGSGAQPRVREGIPRKAGGAWVILWNCLGVALVPASGTFVLNTIGEKTRRRLHRVEALGHHSVWSFETR